MRDRVKSPFCVRATFTLRLAIHGPRQIHCSNPFHKCSFPVAIETGKSRDSPHATCSLLNRTHKWQQRLADSARKLCTRGTSSQVTDGVESHTLDSAECRVQLLVGQHRWYPTRLYTFGLVDSRSSPPSHFSILALARRHHDCPPGLPQVLKSTPSTKRCRRKNSAWPSLCFRP